MKLQDLAAGITLIAKYESSESSVSLHEEIVWVGSPEGYEQMSGEEKAILENHGWEWSEEYECWTRMG